MEQIDKILIPGQGEILMSWSTEDAKAILIQAMCDETMRLKTETDKKERASIRGFLTEAYRVLTECREGEEK